MMIEAVLEASSIEKHEVACRDFCVQVLPKALWNEFDIRARLIEDGIVQNNPELIEWGREEIRDFMALYHEEFLPPHSY